jgi:hypothetical protein
MTDMITLLRQSEAASKARTICSGDMTMSLVSRRDDNHQTVLLLSCASDG